MPSSCLATSTCLLGYRWLYVSIVVCTFSCPRRSAISSGEKPISTNRLALEIPFFAIVGIGFLFAVLLARLLFHGERTLGVIVSGLGLMILSCILLQEVPSGITAVLLGLGLGLVTPEFLLIFIKLSQHCQRGTANTTHLLAWETGITLGLAAACYLSVESSIESIYHIGRIVAPMALLFFVLITYPYYKKKRVR